MLEYAAHASETWTATDLRRAFEEQTRERGVKPADVLAALLHGEEEPDVDGFWENVATNLAAKRLRLLFVADDIPDPLAQVVTFLNAQMLGIEVLAVEIKQFHGESARTLVPRVIGRSAGGSSRGRDGRTPRLSRESFLAKFNNEEVRGVANNLLEAAEQSGGNVHYGGSGVSIRVNCSLWQQHVSVAWLYPEPDIGWMRTRDFSFGTAIVEEDLPEELRTILEQWTNQFASDDFARNVDSRGVKAWAVSYDDAVRHRDQLVNRLRGIVSKLAAL